MIFVDKLRALAILVTFSHSLNSQNIDILVRWELQEVYNQNWPEISKQGYKVRVFKIGFDNSSKNIQIYFRNFFSEETKKIIVMEDFISRECLSKIPKSKIALFMWEPIGKTEDNDYYSYVYTFNDDLVGTNNYRKFCYPHLMPMNFELVNFEEKKLCTAVISHWLPERGEAVRFFARESPDKFDLFGGSPGPFECSSIYKGRIAGHHSESQKINTMKKYKFVLAFENSACPRYNYSSEYCAPGYITEKFFGVFAAGAVPIYYGPNNIEKYIPKNCLINYLDFQTLEELCKYVANMPKEVYEEYLQNIRHYLQSSLAQCFSQKTLELTILEAAQSP